ncbi:hypothetical protein CkaCkLH20_08981 [Colletotrichum karsti]|uniref:Uncharacterized protein n=1 Tax=Colletotrichum karsti TaxID=1095194 RepID=A0A9P6HYA8_9PEZI|nr:uncharacterized protein CkaCkLH20_08981 [Colletotrichum karsti]KAF9873522.1 hypothetical protein CkaCkLH20_08981 [Colletotrichum karsti]
MQSDGASNAFHVPAQRPAHPADAKMTAQSNASSGSMSAKQGSVASFDVDPQSSPHTQRSTSAPENLETFLNDSALAIGSGDGGGDSFGSDKRKQARIQRLKVAIALVNEQLQHTCTNGDEDDKPEAGINDGGSTQTYQPSQSQSNMDDHVRGVGAQFPSLEDLSNLRPSSAE